MDEQRSILDGLCFSTTPSAGKVFMDKTSRHLGDGIIRALGGEWWSVIDEHTTVSQHSIIEHYIIIENVDEWSFPYVIAAAKHGVTIMTLYQFAEFLIYKFEHYNNRIVYNGN